MKKIALFLFCCYSCLNVSAQLNCNVNYFTGNTAYSFAETSGAFWVSTECKIVKIDKTTQQRTYYKPENTLQECCLNHYTLKSDKATDDLWGYYSAYPNYGRLVKYNSGIWTTVDSTHSFDQFIGPDNNSILWFILADSLVSFNGSSFTYTHLSNVTNNIACIDSAGKICIPDSLGVYKYDGTTLTLDSTSNSHLPINHLIFTKYDSLDNAIWVCGVKNINPLSIPPNDTFYISEFKNNNWTNYLLDSISGMHISDMYHDTSGVWFTTYDGYLLRIKNNAVTDFNSVNSNIPVAGPYNPIPISLNFITKAFNGNIYVGSTGQSMYKLDFSTWQKEVLSNSDFMGSVNTCICADKKNNLWIGSSHPGIFSTYGVYQSLYKFDGSNWQQQTGAAWEPAYTDRCTTYTGNLVYFGSNYHLFSYDTNSQFNNIDNFISAQPTYFTGVFSADQNDGLYSYFGGYYVNSHINSYSLSAWGLHTAQQLAIGTNNDIWLLGNDTVCHVSSGTSTIYAINLPFGPYSTELKVDKLNRIWFIGADDVYLFDGNTARKYNFYHNTYVDNASRIYADSSNNIYVGTGPYGGPGEGLFMFNGAGWTHYSTSNTNLLDNTITSIAGDRLGNVWVGSTKGITQFHPCGGDTITVDTTVYLPISVTVLKTDDLKTTSLKFYPNPANSFIFLNLDPNNKMEQISITDLSGKVLLNWHYIKNNRLDVSSLKDGLYIIQVITNDGVLTNKLMIAH